MDDPSAIIEFTRAYLAIFFSGVAVFYTLRIIAKKRTGRSDVVFPGDVSSTTWWNHMLFRVFRITIWMVCLFRWFFPTIDSYLGFFSSLNIWPIVLAGNILLTAGFFFTVAVHFSLGNQWRSGIDPAGPVQLRTDGFYRFSRNPMFVGIATAQVGFLLAMPSVFSGLCLLFGLYTLHRQAVAEETHLLKHFPRDYEYYLSNVRRWI